MTNDKGFITKSDVPAQKEESDPLYTKDKPNIIKKQDNISLLTNDSKFITKEDIPAETDPIYTKDKSNIAFKGANLSIFTNDTNYITKADIPAQVTYTAGTGITISEDNVISLNLENAEDTNY